MCHFFSSLSLLYLLQTLNIVPDSELYQTLDLGLKEEKAYTIQPPFMCFSHLHISDKNSQENFDQKLAKYIVVNSMKITPIINLMCGAI
jgi:hypothetical protein